MDSPRGFLVSLASVFIIACLVYMYERMVGVSRRMSIQSGATPDFIFLMSGAMCVGLEGPWPASFDSADQFLSNVRVFGRSLVCAHIPGYCAALPDSCFSGSSVRCVTFAAGSALRRIGKEAFSRCSRLREIEIPACVEEIGEGCFQAAEEKDDYDGITYVFSLSRVTFAAGSALRRSGKRAFSGCSELREIEIPDGVQVEGYLGVQVRIRQ